MKQYGAFQAKTHFSELLGNVIRGEKCVITKNGIKVAMIIPFAQEGENTNPVKDAIRALKKLKKEITLGKNLSIRQMREEGRK